MYANYHTHTSRCRHADGQDEEYVLAAIAGGFKTLGFSDHTPYLFPGDYYTHMRMYPPQLPEYAASIRSLREKYAGKIDIKLGLEVEYYPDFFPALLPLIRENGVEYMILGQHWCDNEMGLKPNSTASDDEDRLAGYCDQVIAAMETGLFTYVCHPDVLNFTGEPEIYEKHMRRLCKAAAKMGIPLEINMLGIRTNRHYPNPLFWKIAGEEGCTAVTGTDAHSPDVTVDPESEAKVLEIVKKYNLRFLEDFPLVPIK